MVVQGESAEACRRRCPFAAPPKAHEAREESGQRTHDLRIMRGRSFLTHPDASDRELSGSSVGWDGVAAINSKPPVMAVFLRNSRSSGGKAAMLETRQKACAVNVQGLRFSWILIVLRGLRR